MRVYTIGHSTRPIAELVDLLRQHSIALVADVRTVPRSRRNPQFEQTSLQRTLPDAGIGYRHLKSLGGLRRPEKNSINTGWRNPSFRGYADYMQTPQFEQAVNELMTLASSQRVALMCAEAVPWRCHRSLIGDALVVRDVEVVDILSATAARKHALTAFARVAGRHITYPPEQPELPL